MYLTGPGRSLRSFEQHITQFQQRDEAIMSDLNLTPGWSNDGAVRHAADTSVKVEKANPDAKVVESADVEDKAVARKRTSAKSK